MRGKQFLWIKACALITEIIKIRESDREGSLKKGSIFQKSITDAYLIQKSEILVFQF